MEETTINNPPNPTKFYTHFLYKAIFISIFLLILPILPSQAPDFINHKTINTTSWEFLQLVFVGIAVSYGLFSKRNDESHKQQPSSPLSQSYVAGLLQVPSVFDDDTENPNSHENNIQTWSSQYYRGEPIVVVANDLDNVSTDDQKPLLLPVRSLKLKSANSESSESSVRSSTSNWKRVSKNLGKLSSESSDENIVLRSPIPWRSRSGRMEATSETKPNDSPPPPPPPPPPPQRPRELKRAVKSVPKEMKNDGRRSSESATRTQRFNSFSSRNEMETETETEEYLSHDSEIERFIERKGSRRKQLMDEDTDYQKEEKKELPVVPPNNGAEENKEEDGNVMNGDNGPDVDKKADEFIAKFREQIRLQRIASIRKSTAQMNGTR